MAIDIPNLRQPEIPTGIITLQNDNVVVSIDTDGAFLNRLKINGHNIIFRRLLFEIFGTAHPRGGVPLLGPTPGPVKGTDWLTRGVPETMPQHGTDRTAVWQVLQQRANRLELGRYISREEFGLGEFNKKLIFELLKKGVKLTAIITNPTDYAFEIGHAWHPYFRRQGLILPNDLEKRIEGGNLKDAIVIPGSEMGTSIEFSFRDRGTYTLEVDPIPEHWVIWSDCKEHKNRYIAIEPWWAGLGSGVNIPPGQTMSFSMSIYRH